MKRLFFLLLAVPFALSVSAQTKLYRYFGNIDTADLKMTNCDFEKGTNAMVLFSRANMAWGFTHSLVEWHKRIKIFNTQGKDEANIAIEYEGGEEGLQHVKILDACTYNYENGKIVRTPVDSASIYTQKKDENTWVKVFTFPNVKPGSVIEYLYIKETLYPQDLPDWHFQEKLPARYSEYRFHWPSEVTFQMQRRVTRPLLKDSAYVIAMSNIHSLQNEPYMSSYEDNVESVIFHLHSVILPGDTIKSQYDTWDKVAEALIKNRNFGKQLNHSVKNEKELLARVAALHTTDQKIARIFNEVKQQMAWNGAEHWYVDKGISRAWDRKTGSSTEINLVISRLLTQAGINNYPVLVSPSPHEAINVNFPSFSVLRRLVIYVPVDSVKSYFLDASQKENSYNRIPMDCLNTIGLKLDIQNIKSEMMVIEDKVAARRAVLITAEIKPDGTLTGSGEIDAFSYSRLKTIDLYKKEGEKKYIEYLCDYNNSLKVSDLKIENVDVDSLPVKHTFKFSQNLNGDEKYIYFDPNIFSSLRSNPFLAQDRFSNVDFRYRNKYVLFARYNLPAGYKIESVPGNLNLVTGDQSIAFKRMIQEEDGALVVNYSLVFGQSFFGKDNYKMLYDFYKKMYQFLNEQVVLKKI